MSDYYILKDKKPVPAGCLIEWSRQFELKDRIVAVTDINGISVSTVFLGVDHRFEDEGPPLLFETLIFDDNQDQMWRYSTYEEAEAGHEHACEVLKEQLLQKQHKIKEINNDNMEIHS